MINCASCRRETHDTILENDTENKNAEPLSVREAVQEKTVNSK